MVTFIKKIQKRGDYNLSKSTKFFFESLSFTKRSVRNVSQQFIIKILYERISLLLQSYVERGLQRAVASYFYLSTPRPFPKKPIFYP